MFSRALWLVKSSPPCHPFKFSLYPDFLNKKWLSQKKKNKWSLFIPRGVHAHTPSRTDFSPRKAPRGWEHSTSWLISWCVPFSVTRGRGGMARGNAEPRADTSRLRATAQTQCCRKPAWGCDLAFTCVFLWCMWRFTVESQRENSWFSLQSTSLPSKGKQLNPLLTMGVLEALFTVPTKSHKASHVTFPPAPCIRTSAPANLMLRSQPPQTPFLKNVPKWN